MTRGQQGFALTEMIVAVSLVTIMVVLATSRWEARTAHLRLRYATIQVASDLARARQTAQEARAPLVVTFAAADVTVTFSPPGASVAPQTITLKNPSGISTIRVAATGRVSYTFP